MSFKSVNNILDVLKNQAKWQEDPFVCVRDNWPQIVGTVVASHAQPLYIRQRILWVATSSASWAQNLTFERRNLMTELNNLLPTPVVDIRFSTSGWQRQKNHNKDTQHLSPRHHPSYISRKINLEPNTKRITNNSQTNPQTVFQDWVKIVKMRSHGLSLCPQCNCPTPPGELQRWGICYLCAAKKS